MSAVILSPQKTDILVMRFTREGLTLLLNLLNEAELEAPDYPNSIMHFAVKELPEAGRNEITAELICQIMVPTAEEEPSA